MMVIKLGEKLRAMRESKGLTQKQLGDKIDVSESYVSQVEGGKMISLKKLDELAGVLGCEPKDLI